MSQDEYGSRRFYGVYRGVVIDNNDPLGKGRLRVQVPQVLFDVTTDWAWSKNTLGIHTPPPPVGQGVWVEFEGGDPSFPIWGGIFGDNTTQLNNDSVDLALNDLTDVTVPTPTNGQVLTYNSTTHEWVNADVPLVPVDGALGNYLGAYDNTTQTITSNTTAYQMKINTVYEQKNITLASNTVTFNAAGTYNITFSIQFTSTANSPIDAAIWTRVNGVDAPDSTSIVTVPAKHGSVSGKIVPQISLAGTFNAGDTWQLWWHADDTGVKIETVAAATSPTVPESPGVILVISQIMNTQVGPAGPGVPTGGTTGQVLAKIDGTDYHTQWVNQTGGGGSSTLAGLTDVTLTSSTSGDLLKYNGTKWVNSSILSSGVTATTAAVDNNSTNVATTAFVLGQAASATPLIDGTAAVGTSTRYARADHVHPTDTSRASAASPSFTGTITTPLTASAVVLTNASSQLTATTSLADSYLATISTTGKVSNSATTATSANTPSAIVSRDSSGNFSAGDITVTSVKPNYVYGNGNAAYITGISATYPLQVISSVTTKVPFSIKGAASQTADLEQWQNSSGTALAKVDASGNITAASFVKTGGTSSQFLKADGSSDSTTYLTSSTGVTSVSGTSGSVTVTGTTTPVVSLTAAYGDSVNPYGSKTANYVLAAPNGSAGAPTFRAIVAADIPTTLSGITSIGTASVDLTAAGNLVVSGNLDVKGTTTFIESTTLQVADKNIEIGKVTSPTDSTADGGGVTLKGATDKTITWDLANTNWTSSENWNLATGKTYKINNTTVLSGSALGSGVTGSSLTSVGTITSGTWNGSTVAVSYGGTGTGTAGITAFNNITGYTATGATGTTSTNIVFSGGSPTFTGTPASTTAAVDTNTTQIATTAFVIGQAASATPLVDGTAAVGTSTRYARADHVHPTDTSRAPASSKYIVQGTTDSGLSGAQFLGALSTGIVKVTNTTGVLSTAVAGDFPTLNQNTTGSAGSVANALTISSPLSGTSFNGSSAVSIGLSTGYGDTQNPYASKTANYVLAAPNGSAGAPTFRAMVAADVPTLNQNTTGSAATLTTSRNLWGQSFNGSADVTGSLTSVGNITGTTNLSLYSTGGSSYVQMVGSSGIVYASTSISYIDSGAAGQVRIGYNNATTIGLGTNANTTSVYIATTGTSTGSVLKNSTPMPATYAQDTQPVGELGDIWIDTSSNNVVGTFQVPSYNFLINGAFDIWQRTTSLATTGAYVADRWYCASANCTFSRDTALLAPGTQYSLKATMSGAGTPLIYQAIETLNAVAMAGQTVTLSAYLASSTSAVGLIRMEYSTSADNAVTGSWTTIASATPTTATTMARYTLTCDVPSTAKSIRVLCATNTALASTNTFTVGAVQLEVGTIATQFRRNAPSVQAELIACQRYYYRKVGTGTTTVFGIGIAPNTTQAYIDIQFPTSLRTVPTTVETTGTASNYRIDNLSTNGASPTIAISANYSSTETISLLCTTTGISAGPWKLLGTVSGAYLGFSAEL